MEYKLPVIIIEGTEFVVDVNSCLLQEKSNPHNTISFSHMKDTESGYEFEYCRDDKNIPFFFHSDNSVNITLPSLIELDPEGMARKYNLSVHDLKGKTDFDVMVDPVEYNKRVAMGMLPTVDIAGHTFYVDLRMDMLRPKDDFLSKGIVFSKIEGYYIEDKEKYLVPYNPKTHEFQELDWGKITEYPKDLIAVEFPSERKLDPIGWNRLTGADLHDGLKHTGLRSHFNAEIIPWEKTVLHNVIRENRERENKQVENKNKQPSDPDREQGRRRGRKM